MIRKGLRPLKLRPLKLFMSWIIADDEHSKGSSDPVVARTIIQAGKLVAPYELNEGKNIRITSIYNEVRRHLHECDDISQRIMRETTEIYEQVRSSLSQYQGNSTIRLPAVSNLTNSVETYLYHAKLVFRELKDVFKPILGKEFNPSTQYVHIGDWSEKRFGKDNSLTKWLRNNSDWIQKVIDSRNAVDHPERDTLVIRNFHISHISDGKSYIEGPIWSLNGEMPKSLLKDMQVLTNNILEFSEILLIYCLRNLKNIYPIVIAEIPEEKRNEDVPLRFIPTLEQELDENGVYKHRS